MACKRFVGSIPIASTSDAIFCRPSSHVATAPNRGTTRPRAARHLLEVERREHEVSLLTATKHLEHSSAQVVLDHLKRTVSAPDEA